MIAKDTLDMYEWLRYNNSKLYLHMTTNGGGRSDDWWRNIAKVFGKHGRVTFSVDGLEDTNHLYRVNVDWKRVENSMDVFTQAGGKGLWVFLIFEHNEHQIEEARQMSVEYGFSKFFTVDHDRDNMSVFDAKGNFSHIIKPQSHKAPRDDGWRSIDNLKKSIFNSLHGILKPEAILCTNTSSISVTTVPFFNLTKSLGIIRNLDFRSHFFRSLGVLSSEPSNNINVQISIQSMSA